MVGSCGCIFFWIVLREVQVISIIDGKIVEALNLRYVVDVQRKYRRCRHSTRSDVFSCLSERIMSWHSFTPFRVD